jgi:hypothetical protein
MPRVVPVTFHSAIVALSTLTTRIEEEEEEEKKKKKGAELDRP